MRRTGGSWVAMVRWLVGCLACCGVGLIGSPGVAFGQAPSFSLSGGIGTSSSLFEGTLNAPGAQRSDEGQQSIAAQQAQRNTPAAVAARAASRTKFAHITAARAAQVAGEIFPEEIHRPTGGPPLLPAGEKIAHYISNHAAQLDLPHGKHALVESMQPMAIETSPKHWVPVDLSLAQTGSVFESKRPLVGVLIPKRLRDGVQVLEDGVSLTPVDANGVPLGGSEGAVDGASVLYANTQTDTDTVVKPTTRGFEADAVLRSVNSPEQLYFRVGLPQNGSLVQPHGHGGPVKVLQNGRTIALILPPGATDAAGTAVPVSMSFKGDLLAMTVATHAGAYQWPIAVDPELAKAEDNSFGPTECHQKGEAERQSSNWCWFSHATGSGKFKPTWYSGKAVELWNEGPVSTGDYTGMAYHTQGESKIYQVEGWTAGHVTKGVAKLEIARKRSEETGEVETSVEIAKNGSWEFGNRKLCAKPEANGECSLSAGSASNIAAFKMEATESISETYSLEGELQNTYVYITQEKAPEVTFNETSGLIEGRANVLYGKEHGTGLSQAWLGPYSGAFEVKAHDPGIGVSWAQIYLGGFRQEEPIWESGKCNGVQCEENYSTAATYNPAMPDGEQTIEWDASNSAGKIPGCESCLGLLGTNIQLIKIDATPPYNLEVGGWPATREISATPHALTIEATDGKSPTNSSGMNSVSVSVDGGPQSGVPGLTCSTGLCTLGPTTAKGKWTLNAEGLTEGVHRLVVTATDNAGNVASREFTFDVRHGSPVSVGPGTVDPTTGQLKLSATDVSLAGAGQVARVYESRNPTLGSEGPLGAQWALGLGGGEGLTVLPTGSVVLASSAGATTTFTRKSNGEFEAPLGDENIKIESKEKVPGKGITEYLLKETVAGTTTTFEQPTGTQNTVPVYSNQFSAASQLGNPQGLAFDSSGNAWVLDESNSRILKFSQAGTLLATYGSSGPWQGQFVSPRGIAVNQSTGNVYVTDEGNNRIVELNSSGSFVRAFGWSVNLKGKAEYEICTTYCQAGVAGSGAGQLKEARGVTIDAAGNVWVADYGNNRIQEFGAGGEYLKMISPGEGEAAGKFKAPFDVAFSGGNLYVVEYGNNRVQEFNSAGGYLANFGKLGAGNGEFNGPRSISADPITGNLYVADTGNNRVEEFKASGGFITKFGAAGSGAGQLSEPKGVAFSVSGGIYVSDFNNKRVEQWSRPAWLPTVSEGPVISAKPRYSYEAVEMEVGKWIIEPTEALAPPPAGVSCGTKPEELKKGCRALTFNYGTATTATGVNPGQWGDYKGQLKRVEFHGWDPAKAAMTKEVYVAQYEYDNKGRLRAEWDPRTSPALKTIYGYDEEGHVVSVSPPGEEPWLLHYGTLSGEPSTGRLLSATRPAAGSTTVLKEQKAMEAPVNAGAPTLSSTTPVIGTTLKAQTQGTWNNSPLAYFYQWEDCYPSACSPILGATNQSYTPQASDSGYKLVVQVTAENATGATRKVSAESSKVSMPAPVFKLTWGSVGSGSLQLKNPQSVAIDAGGNVWVTDNQNNRISEFSSTGTFLATVGWGVKDGKNEPEKCTTTCQAGIAGTGSAQFSGPWGIAVNRTTGNVYVSDQGGSRVQVFNSSGSYLRVFGTPGSGSGQIGAAVAGLAVDSLGNVWVADNGNSRVDEFSGTGVFVMAVGWGVVDGKSEAQVCSTTCQAGKTGSGNGQFSTPVSITFVGGNVYVEDYNNDRVEEFSSTGAYISKFGSLGSGEGLMGLPYGITTEPVSGDLLVSECTNSRVQVFNPSGGYAGVFGSPGTGNGQFSCATGIASSPTGEVYVLDPSQGRVEKFTPTYSTNNPLPAAPSLESSATSTIEYRVPLSGSGLPNLTESEVEKWGQGKNPAALKDFPVEGMAIFPPDKPMGWPAKEYERATINYMDQYGHTVNVASPTGGFPSKAISTTEYNGINQVVRTLSAANRAAALNEAKSTEKAELWDTKNVYGAQGRLEETRGPQHTVKIVVGKEGKSEEALARDHVKYFYDEGAPEGKTYNLVTKTVDGAETASKAEYDKRTTATSFGGQGTFGWTLRKPTSVTKDFGGLNLTSTTRYDENTGNVLETKSPAGTKGGSESSQPPVYSSSFGSLGSGEGQLHDPRGLALDAKGELLVADEENSRIDVFNEAGGAETAIGSLGSGNGQLKEPRGVAVDSKGNIWVTDTANYRLEEFNEKKEFVRVAGWGVSNGESKFQTCTTGCRAGLVGAGVGQFALAKGIAVDSHNNVWVADTGNNRIEELNEKGESPKAFGSVGNGNGQFKEPRALSVAPNGAIWVVDTNNSRIEVLKENGEWGKTVGSAGIGNGEFKEPKGIFVDTHGKVWVSDSENNRVEQFSEAGKYEFQFGTAGTGNGQFKEPWGVLLDAHGNVFVSDGANNRVEKWTSSAGNPEAHDTKIAYYSAESESSVTACRNHPEWANLPCQTEPAAQPGNGLPELPVVNVAKYNVWDEAETTAEQFGSGTEAKTRTVTQKYDAAGRAETSEETSTIDAVLPKVTNEYNTETGTREKQKTTEGSTKTITSAFNTLGQLTSYTDADGNVSKYVYDLDGRVEEVNDGKGTQSYVHDPATGLLTKLVDSAAGTFTATYNVEGKMLTTGYPNGMTAGYTYDSAGSSTGIEYVKNTHCATTCPEVWFSNTAVQSIHGEILKQASTLSKESYAYDNVGRLTEAQETPAGKVCTTRLYAYDEESNRTGLTTRKSAGETCATEGGTLQTHSYDTANRLTDTGVTYETFGNTTKLPAADAEEHELTSNYYVDNQVAGQTQNGETIKYSYDPAGRARETVSSGKTASTLISHYSGSGEALAWINEGGTNWTRNVPGIDGSLAAIQSSSGSTVLELHDLQGNVVATAAVSETETKLLPGSYNSTEFGVPNEGKTPPKYAWLGAGGVASETSFGTGTVTQSGATYVPQIARDLQTAPVVPPGAFPNGQGTGSQYGSEIPGWYVSLSETQSAATIAEYAAKQEAEACQVDPGSCGLLEDPIKHFRVWEAKKIVGEIAEVLELIQMVEAPGAVKDAALAFAAVGAGTALAFDPVAFAGAIVGAVAVAKAVAWFARLGLELQSCIETLHSQKDSHGGCRIEYQGILGSPIPWFPDSPIGSWCKVMSSNTVEIHGCTKIDLKRLEENGSSED